METNVFGYLVEQTQNEIPEFLEFDMRKIGNIVVCKLSSNILHFILYYNFIYVLCGHNYFILLVCMCFAYFNRYPANVENKVSF
jgi:hypothetical protein